MKTNITLLAALLLLPVAALHAEETTAAQPIDRETLDKWSAPYRGWHYQPGHVIPANPNIPGHAEFHNPDVPCVYQLPGQPDKWFMSFIAFNGKGYNSFVAESTDLVKWTNPRLAMGFGKPGAFDFGGCVVGAYLYESYDIKAPRVLKKRDGKFWTLYGCYEKQTGYEADPGYEGVATSGDGLAWTGAADKPILAVQDPDCGEWEKECIYQPWLVEHEGRYYDFYNAKQLIGGYRERIGLATSTNLLDWKRYENNPVVDNRPPGSYDCRMCADGKVFRDGDHWVMFYFGMGKDGVHIMAAFSRDLQHWTAHPEPLYKSGGNPSGLDKQFAHKISLVYNPKNETFYLHYCAVGNKGRGIGLITSKPLETDSAIRDKPVLQASASHINDGDTVDALNDGVVPTASNDVSIPRFTWWNHKGGTEWVQYDFPQPKEVSGVGVYWFDDTGTGQCRIPKTWRLLYRDGDEWKPVPGTGTTSATKDQFDSISFPALNTKSLRIEVVLQPECSGGVLKWRINPTAS